MVNCDFALKHKRYTWRHDSVLKNIELSIASLVADFNQKKPTTLVKATRKAFEASFVRKGERKNVATKHLSLSLQVCSRAQTTENLE